VDFRNFSIEAGGIEGPKSPLRQFHESADKQSAPVISIKQFLSLNTEADQALVHVVRVLIEGIGHQIAGGDADDCARFRETLQEFSDALIDGTSRAELLVRAGSVLNGFEEYNHRALKQQRLQTAELQNMVKMLAYTVRAVSAASSSNVGILGDIEQRIAVASELDDVRIIKAKLSDCLTDIRREAERQQKEAAETIEQLNHGLNQARKRAPVPHDDDAPDPITGLPPRPEAEAALAQAGHGGTRAYAAILVLDRLQIVKQRFGREVGDEILAAFTRMVRTQLGPEDQLFRWSELALLALLARPDSLESVRNEVGRLMATRLEHTIQTPSRSILLPVSARWTLFPVMASPRLIYQKLDAFAAAPTSRE
jgi:GGDEF domain-containing protein